MLKLCFLMFLSISEVNYLDLASLMVRDGEFERAKPLLAKIDVSHPEFTWKRYYSVNGLYFFGIGELAKAEEQFLLAIEKGEKNLELYLAQIAHRQGRHRQALSYIQSAQKKVAYYLLKHRILVALGQSNTAYQALLEGLQQYPGNQRVLLQKLDFLLEKKLLRVSQDAANTYLSRDKVSAEDFQRVSQVFSKHKRHRQAQEILQRGLLKHAENEGLSFEFALSLVKSEKIHAAQSVLAELSARTGKYFKETAEVSRRAGMGYQALWFNSKISDQKEKLKQRLGIQLELNRFDLANAMGERLKRNGLLAEDEISYALAYSQFSLQNYDLAEEHLNRIVSPQFFEKALALRSAIMDCRSNEGECMW